MAAKLISRVVIATGPDIQVFWVFTATFTLVEPYPTRLEQLPKISAGGVGSPKRVLSPTLHLGLPTTTSMKISNLE